MATGSTGKSGNQKRRNNARRSAARKMQQEHPGLRYQEAMDLLAGTSPTNSARAPHLSDYLGMRTVQDITTHYQSAGGAEPDLRIPIGAGPDGVLYMNLEQARRAGTGPHTFIVGGMPTARTAACRTMCTALRAINAPPALEVVWAGQDAASIGVSADRMFGGEDAQEAFSAWLDDEVVRRQIVLQKEACRGADELPVGALVRSVIVIDLPPSTAPWSAETDMHAKWWGVCKRLLAIGRSLGMHLVCCVGRLDTEELQSSVRLHITHIVALQQPAVSTAQLAVGVGAQLRELEVLGLRDAHLILRGAETCQVPFVLTQESPDFIEAVNRARALITS